jgi:hypothetical protein
MKVPKKVKNKGVKTRNSVGLSKPCMSEIRLLQISVATLETMTWLFQGVLVPERPSLVANKCSPRKILKTQ